MVIFRENAEDIYAGIEWKADSDEAKKVIAFLQNEMGVKKIRFPESCGIGIKPMSKAGTERLVRAAIEYAIDNDRDSVTLVHKGNIMKFTEGAFKDWACPGPERVRCPAHRRRPLVSFKNPKTGKTIVVKDVIADAFLQQILLRPAEYDDVIACMNLNGDYISDALAAQVGGIGIAPGANIGDGVALFEATTAPRRSTPARGQGEPGPHPLRRDDAAPPGLDRGGRPHRQGHGSGHRQQDRHLRLRATDGRGHPCAPAPSSPRDMIDQM